jgi:sulfur relay (sulfurtransferase) DsrF/TusC family protein
MNFVKAPDIVQLADIVSNLVNLDNVADIDIKTVEIVFYWIDGHTTTWHFVCEKELKKFTPELLQKLLLPKRPL